jgi:glycosyltransferase involved in cell wall biosynthesis
MFRSWHLKFIESCYKPSTPHPLVPVTGSRSGITESRLLAGAGMFLMINNFETGGTERQFVETAQSLRSAGFSVHLGCLQKKGSFLDQAGEVTAFPARGSLYGVQSIRSRYRLAKHLRRSKIGIAHAFDFYTNLILIPAAKLARTPVVIGSQRQLGDLLTAAQFRAQLAAFRVCDAVVCNSRAAAERLREAGLPGKKLVVIGNALSKEAFASTTPAFSRNGGVLRVGMIARMNAAYKNHGVFLRAAARLSRKYLNLEFLLVGDGQLRPELEREAERLQIQNFVRFVGDRRDIPAVLASMDVSVIASASEGLSNVMLESMAAGVPVVATSVGGNVELGGEQRAQLVRPDDDEALANALDHLLANERLRSDMADRSRQFVQENFKTDRIAMQYAQLYSELIARKRGRQQEAAGKHISTGPSRMRVAFVAPTFRHVGGQAVQAELLLSNWRSDSEVDAQFIPVDPSVGRWLSWLEKLPLVRTIFREPFYLISLWKGLKRVELVHIFSASYSSFLLGPLPAWGIARLLGKKTLINYRSGACRDHLHKSHIARSVLERTDRIVVPSGYLAAVLQEFGLTAHIVPNIVDLSQFACRTRKPLRPHLVCTRGFHRFYSIDVVVRAFAEVQKSFPEAQLDLVGGGPQENDVRQLVTELNLSGINFLGVISRQEIGLCYDRADIFVNASNVDNMPVSVLEAFASGMPVVSTAPDGIRYVVEHEHTGLLSPVGDAHALAMNVVRLLRDVDLAKRLAVNAHREMEKYQWRAVRALWLEIYRDATAIQ